MTEPLRIGVIGVGVMGADHAERVARRIGGVRLAAVSDRTRPGVRMSRGDWGLPRRLTGAS